MAAANDPVDPCDDADLDTETTLAAAAVAAAASLASPPGLLTTTPTLARPAAPERDGPGDPLSLNLARIVFRLLTDPRGWRVDDLKATLGIADRTYRKYKALLARHFDPLWDRDGATLLVEEREGDARWLRLRDSPRPPESEPGFETRVAALELARQAFSFLAPTAIGQDIDAFRQEFLAQVDDRAYVFRGLLRHLDRRLLFVGEASKDYAPHGATLATVLRGLLDGRRLEVLYEGARGRTGPGVVEPLTLLVWRGSLYLIARYKGYKDPRYLAIDRIRAVRCTSEAFHYPPPQTYRPEALVEGAFGIFREPDARPRAVELVFDNDRWLKMYVRERRWHPTQRFEDLPDGCLRMTFTAQSLFDVRTWVRGFGPSVRVVRPAGLLDG